jgi:formylmethanofuran dehydrogenase subunit B
MNTEQRIENVTCLGCGCSCDDVTVVVSNGRIIEVTPACPLGRAWFGDGQVPDQVLCEGHSVPLEEALARLADMLLQARGRCLVYLGSDLTTQAQRAALTIADLLNATVETETSPTAANGLISAQRRGRAGATLGEVRNRGDVFLFWGVDPRERYPRFLARYSLDSVGTQVPTGRHGRYVISVSVGNDKALESADSTFAFSPDQEIAALTLMRAMVLGNKVAVESNLTAAAAQISERLAGARYTVLVHDAEPTAERRNSLRAEALIALAQALNGPTRAALISLRAGGNRVGAESVLTWQTGYPFAVDYSLGYPRYRPGSRGIAGLENGRYRTALLVGSAPTSDGMSRTLANLRVGVIGPRASRVSFPASVAIDTGLAGIHDAGTAYRMDEVPLGLRPCLEGPRSAFDVLEALAQGIRSRLQAGAA